MAVAANPPGGDPTPAQPPAPAAEPPAISPEQFTALEKQLKEAQSKLTAFEQADEERKTAEMTENEKLKKQVSDLTGELTGERERTKTQAIRHAVESEAAKLGFIDPASAFKLIDLAGVDVKDGAVTGHVDALKALQKSTPGFFGTPGAPSRPSGGGNTGSNPGSVNITSESLWKMSPTDFAKLDAELKAGTKRLI